MNSVYNSTSERIAPNTPVLETQLESGALHEQHESGGYQSSLTSILVIIMAVIISFFLWPFTMLSRGFQWCVNEMNIGIFHTWEGSESANLDSPETSPDIEEHPSIVRELAPKDFTTRYRLQEEEYQPHLGRKYQYISKGPRKICRKSDELDSSKNDIGIWVLESCEEEQEQPQHWLRYALYNVGSTHYPRELDELLELDRNLEGVSEEEVSEGLPIQGRWVLRVPCEGVQGGTIMVKRARIRSCLDTCVNASEVDMIATNEPNRPRDLLFGKP